MKNSFHGFSRATLTCRLLVPLGILPLLAAAVLVVGSGGGESPGPSARLNTESPLPAATVETSGLPRRDTLRIPGAAGLPERSKPVQTHGSADPVAQRRSSRRAVPAASTNGGAHNRDTSEAIAARETAPSSSRKESLETAAAANVASSPASVFRTPLAYEVSDESFQRQLPRVPLEVIDSVRSEFETAVGVDVIPLDSPEYARRWQIAAPTALERMRTLFGWAAVAEFERQAALQPANAPK